MTALALLLARRGSKGVPRKNLREICGKPCLCWTLDDAVRAREAGAVDRIALSSDDSELLNIGENCGIDTLDRPADLAGDDTSIDDAARHAITSLNDPQINAIVILYGNVPVRPSDLIERAVTLYRETGCDSVQSYAPVGKYHPWWTAVVDVQGAGAVRPWEGATLNHGVYRRQDLPPAHIPDGGVLVVSRESLFCQHKGVAPGPHAFLGRDHRGILTAQGEVLDIDCELDLIVAERMLERRLGAVR